MTMLRRAMLAGSALALVAGVAGCSDPEPQPAPIENSAFDEDAPPPEPIPEASYEPAPPIAENVASVNATEALPPPPPIEPDQQVLDDASATGMTSRTTRGEPQDDAAPVDDAMSNQQGE